MTDMLREAAYLALAALEDAHYTIEHKQDAEKREQALKSLREALAHTELTRKQPIRETPGAATVARLIMGRSGELAGGAANPR